MTADPHFARAWADASTIPFWLDHPERPAPRPPLAGDAVADLAIVGGGFTGLWAALHAKEDDPGRDVILLEGERIAFGGSGRNGGFCEYSLTHGWPNGLSRFPDEIHELERQGKANYEQIAASIARYEIGCSWEPTGVLGVGVRPHEVDWCRDIAEDATRRGEDIVFLDRDAVRAEIASPAYLAGFWRKAHGANIDPARLAWGLARAAEGLGVRICEQTPVLDVRSEGTGIALSTATGSIRARRVILGTNAFPPLRRRMRKYVIPIYDYVLVTEPLDAERMSAIGWAHRQGAFDLANRFHYFRLTDDDRILWGGYDAIYHYGNGLRPEHERRDATYSLLAQQFAEMFPQLADVRFTHAWAGAIDTCSRFSVFFGTELDGRLAYAAGYTGLGVGATRWGARVALDLVDGATTERTRLRMVRTKPVPFPPEPLRSAGVWITRRALARSDRRQGRRGPWLRLLDAVGLGFDS